MGEGYHHRMKVIICGSRYLGTDLDMWMLATAVEDSGFEITEIISGCASGIDSLALVLGTKWNIPEKRFPANWDELGRSAGYTRNFEMIQYADAVIAILWRRAPCKGTRHTIKLGYQKGIPVYVAWVD